MQGCAKAEYQQSSKPNLELIVTSPKDRYKGTIHEGFEAYAPKEFYTTRRKKYDIVRSKRDWTDEKTKKESKAKEFPDKYWQGKNRLQRARDHTRFLCERILAELVGESFRIEDLPLHFSYEVVERSGLRGMVHAVYDDDCISAVIDAYQGQFSPWEFRLFARHYWNDGNIRKKMESASVDLLYKKLQLSPEDIETGNVKPSLLGQRNLSKYGLAILEKKFHLKSEDILEIVRNSHEHQYSLGLESLSEAESIIRENKIIRNPKEIQSRLFRLYWVLRGNTQRNEKDQKVFEVLPTIITEMYKPFLDWLCNPLYYRFSRNQDNCSYGELVSEAKERMARYIIPTYDPKKGEFTTLATGALRRYLVPYLNRCQVVHMTSTDQEQAYKIREERKKLREELRKKGERVSYQQEVKLLSERIFIKRDNQGNPMYLPSKKIRQLDSAIRNPIRISSLNRPKFKDDDEDSETYQDSFQSDIETPEDLLMSREFDAVLSNKIQTELERILSPSQLAVLNCRYRRGMTMKETAEELHSNGILKARTRARIWGIEKQIEEKIASNQRLYKAYLESMA